MIENFIFLNNVDFTKKEITTFDPSSTIIYSMNFKVHQYLESLSIKHEMGEDALDKNDLNLIFDKTVSLYTWYKHPLLANKLQFHDINILGMMDDAEFHTFMMTKLYELRIIQKILKNKSPKKIISNITFINFIKKIVVKNTKFIEIGKPINEKMVYDKIEIKFNLGTIPISFKIPRNYYFKIKSIIENLVCNTNNLWLDISKIRESILLLEINPSVYSELISNLSKSNKQIILLNNRRSAIWNLNSISTLKKSNSKILSFERVLNKKELQSINHQKDHYMKIINGLMHEKHISTIFMIDEIEFWDEIKFELINTFKKRLVWYMQSILATKKFLSNSDIRSVLSLNVIGETEKLILSQIPKNINSVMLEHAFANYTKEISRYDILSNYSLFPDKVAVWGNVQKNYLSKIHGISDEKILVCGSPRHDNFFKQSKKISNVEKKSILLCPRPIVELTGRHHTRMYIKYERALKKTVKNLHQIKNSELIIKLHPGDIEHNNLIKKIVNEINSDIVIFHTKPIEELIRKSNLVLVISPDGFDPSTVILESIILKKPVINLVLDEEFYDFSYEQSQKMTILMKLY